MPGRGNQAYQFDTLPLRRGGVEELKRGDLIFYEAAYKDSTRRRQRRAPLPVELSFLRFTARDHAQPERYKSAPRH